MSQKETQFQPVYRNTKTKNKKTESHKELRIYFSKIKQ